MDKDNWNKPLMKDTACRKKSIVGKARVGDQSLGEREDRENKPFLVKYCKFRDQKNKPFLTESDK